MTFSEFANEFAKEAGISKTEAKRLLKVFYKLLLKEVLDKEQEVRFSRLGTFMLCKSPSGFGAERSNATEEYVRVCLRASRRSARKKKAKRQ